MQRIRCFALPILVGLLALPVFAQKKYSPSEAKDHFGETAIVCGEVVSTRFADSTKGQPTFLNLDKVYPNQIFAVVIWGNNRSKFVPPENDYKGKRICFTGKVTAVRWTAGDCRGRTETDKDRLREVEELPRFALSCPLNADMPKDRSRSSLSPLGFGHAPDSRSLCYPGGGASCACERWAYPK